MTILLIIAAALIVIPLILISSYMLLWTGAILMDRNGRK